MSRYPTVRLTCLTTQLSDEIETAMVAELQCISIYRPPSSPIDFIDKLGDIIDKVSCECKENIITGDFNYDVSGDDSSGTSNPVMSCFNLFQMLQRIHDPTELVNSPTLLLISFIPLTLSL